MSELQVHDKSKPEFSTVLHPLNRLRRHAGDAKGFLRILAFPLIFLMERMLAAIVATLQYGLVMPVNVVLNMLRKAPAVIASAPRLAVIALVFVAAVAAATIAFSTKAVLSAVALALAALYLIPIGAAYLFGRGDRSDPSPGRVLSIYLIVFLPALMLALVGTGVGAALVPHVDLAVVP